MTKTRPGLENRLIHTTLYIGAGLPYSAVQFDVSYGGAYHLIVLRCITHHSKARFVVKQGESTLQF